ncbi:unnamed protein product [marine sediment metagenome]|uniref:Uncharacterized protein n=1 Tax=marine sediment metagenome TaxID=412755 RepID=X1QUU2_9ZZZZ
MFLQIKDTTVKKLIMDYKISCKINDGFVINIFKEKGFGKNM